MKRTPHCRRDSSPLLILRLINYLDTGQTNNLHKLLDTFATDGALCSADDHSLRLG